MSNNFFYRARSFLMESCGPGTGSLVPMLTFVHDGRGTGLPSAFFSILIFVTHAHLASLLLNTICFTSLAISRVSGPLQSAVTHLQSLTTGLWPGTQQLTYFRRLSTKSLVALNSVCVILSKIRAFLRANKVLLGRFFFLTLDGFR
jgi:hypothetical protein